MNDVLALREVSGEYRGERVVGPVSLEVQRGEQIALVGASGAGKSTLLGLMYAHWRAQAAMVPQALGLVNALSVFHNVYMGRLSRRSTLYNLANLMRPMKREVAEVEAVLGRLTMAPHLWSRAGELSGGQRQRVAVARALHQGAGIVLADEPVSALDGPLSEVVLGEITRGYDTAVLAMHDVELALRYTGRVVGIQGGRIVLDEPSVRLSAQDLLPLY